MLTKVYLADTASLRDDAHFAALYDALPEFRKSKVNSLRMKPDKMRSVAAWTLLEKALILENVIPANGRSFTEDDFNFPEFGRPSLKNYSYIHFNLSHSGSKVLCSVSDVPTGCDVEKIPSRYDTERIAKRFYTAAEYRYIENEADEDKKKELFYRIWTLKESYVKTTGAGLALPYKSFSVDPTGLDTKKRMSASALAHARKNTDTPFEFIFCHTYDCRDGYAYACCAHHDGFTDLISMEV